jgi:phospholipid/cholesterol/gamma-HCH transport system ATP-binding protein
MTCLDNVALPLRKHKNMSVPQARADARRRLEQVHMQDFGDRFPAELGDGMRKRVAIARALTLDPRYVLFDEPTTSLDPVSARRVDKLIRELSDTLGVTSIVVSHDLASIFSIADRVVMLYQGFVRMLGTPEELRRSDDLVIEQFINGRADGPIE